MARPGVTYEDIAKAASQLKGENKNPTIEAVRAILGTGSISTINNHLRKWKQADKQSKSLATKENIPEELIAIVKGLWEQILLSSETKVEKIKDSYEKEFTILNEDLAKYKANNQRWQKMFNVWQQEKVKLENDKSTLEQALEFTQKENDALITKQDGALKQLSDKQARIDELNKLNKQAQENLEHYRESQRLQRLQDQENYAANLQNLQTEIKNKNNQFDVCRNELIDSRNQIQQNNLIIENLTRDNKRIKAENTSQNNSIKSLENTLAVKDEQLKTQNKELKELESKLKLQTEEYIESKINIKLLKQQFDDTNKALEDLTIKNNLLSQNKWELAEEKAKLQGQLKQMQEMA